MEEQSSSIHQPLLKPYSTPSQEGAQLSEWAQDLYVGDAPRQPGSVEVEAQVTGHEIRTAASTDPYPPWIYGALLTTPESSPAPQGVAVTQQSFQESHLKAAGSVQILDEVELRELLIDHVGHRCCWGSRPARRWRIHAVEDCNAYVGTLETFIEERDIIGEIEPYAGGKIDGKDSGPEPGPWELDMRSEFPLLFVSRKEARVKVPHSEAEEKCSGCSGRGEVACPTCNVNQEPGFYTAQLMMSCSSCHGRGLIAHSDGSDTICEKCKGKGKLPCLTCQSRGLIKCEKCRGGGSLLTRKIAIVRWRTLLTRKVSACSSAASVPDDVFHRAKGVQLYNSQAYQCKPACFSDSFALNKFSSDIIADRASVPPTARVICERHQITVVPVTRVIMTHRNRSFTFYVIGLSREVYVKDYPSQWCWGLCSCLNWLSP